MKSIRLAVLPVVFAMLSVVPASADIIDYTFTTGVDFVPTGNLYCSDTSGATAINLQNCTEVNLTSAPGQSITAPGSLFYYLGSVQGNEAGARTRSIPMSRAGRTAL